MVRDTNTGKPVDVKKKTESVEKREKTQKWNSFMSQVKAFTLGAFIVAVLILGIYVYPRWNAYLNAIRVAHSNPEAVEQLRVDEITKKGSFEITLSK